MWAHFKKDKEEEQNNGNNTRVMGVIVCKIKNKALNEN